MVWSNHDENILIFSYPSMTLVIQGHKGFWNYVAFLFNHDQMKSCEARTVQDSSFAHLSTFASGLRSEHSNHSWLILAGSGLNRLSSVSEIRPPSSFMSQRLFLRTGGYDVGIGLGICCNDWVWSLLSFGHLGCCWYMIPSFSSLRSTIIGFLLPFWRGNLIVTRFRLLFVWSCNFFLSWYSYFSVVALE